ncbi:hypothetical protein [Deinococcus cellulosilyticus]|uniref:Phage major capsid protein n=1 Tax=Deinococcus cellulosilyticus (strain DSM 18568 / NBRC 106333 / KACC 11606 / 5516J-15) TaxID=1223518 RepID=A0A511N0K4_DEIC1|nr:hypothetical protein [Deinococcus cellulosilyticus]GEM45906.1 hypothetical protein DC3_15410 [Deinococcus cellulosilyticus NBRC 106333 = KACC 11606]
MIRRLDQLTMDIYQDAAKQKASHGLSYINLNDHLLELLAKGDIEEGLIRMDLVEKGISPVRQILALNGIRLGGLNAHTLSVFFPKESDYVRGADVLFPALMNEMLEEGFGIRASDSFTVGPSTAGDSMYPLQQRGLVDQRLELPQNTININELVSVRIGVDGDGYKSAVINNDQRGRQNRLARTAPGADLPLYTISTAERSVRIYKYGGRVRWPYEVARRMKINVVALALQEMAFAENLRRIDEAIDVGINGDGNGNGATLDPGSPVADWTVQTLDEWTMTIAYNSVLGVNRVMGDLTEVKRIRALRYPTASKDLTPDQLNMYQQGSYAMPDGTPLRLAPSGSTLDSAKTLLAWNTGRALEEVVENGSQITEMAKFTTNQTEELSLSINIGYAKPFSNSFQTITRS